MNVDKWDVYSVSIDSIPSETNFNTQLKELSYTKLRIAPTLE